MIAKWFALTDRPYVMNQNYGLKAVCGREDYSRVLYKINGLTINFIKHILARNIEMKKNYQSLLRRVIPELPNYLRKRLLYAYMEEC